MKCLRAVTPYKRCNVFEQLQLVIHQYVHCCQLRGKDTLESPNTVINCWGTAFQRQWRFAGNGNVLKLIDIVTDSVTYIQAPINICILLDPLYEGCFRIKIKDACNENSVWATWWFSTHISLSQSEALQSKTRSRMLSVLVNIFPSQSAILMHRKYCQRKTELLSQPWTCKTSKSKESTLLSTNVAGAFDKMLRTLKRQIFIKLDFIKMLFFTSTIFDQHKTTALHTTSETDIK